MSYNGIELISVFLNLLFGGGLIAVLTMRAQKKKASAEAEKEVASADSIELENVEKAIKIWREMAESLKAELQESREKYNTALADLKRTVDRLNTTNTKILKLLEKISPDNIEGPVEQIKQEINNAHA